VRPLWQAEDCWRDRRKYFQQVIGRALVHQAGCLGYLGHQAGCQDTRHNHCKASGLQMDCDWFVQAMLRFAKKQHAISNQVM
jgi:hypothetical protein